MKRIIAFFAVVIILLSCVSCLRDASGTEPDKKSETDPEIISTGGTDDTAEATLPDETAGVSDDDRTSQTDKNQEENQEEKIGTSEPEPDDVTDGTEPDDTSEEETSDPDEETAVDVIGIPDQNGNIPVSKIQLDHYSTTLYVGQIDMPWETILPENATQKGTYWQSSDPSVASVDTYGRVTALSAGKCTVTVTSYSNENVHSEFAVTVIDTDGQTEPTYIDGIMIANKSYPLPSTYNPGVDAEAYSALQSMIDGAANDGITITLISGFRSYQTQQSLYSNYLLREGRDAADKYSARPGYSEHQTGLAFDLNSLYYSFADTKEGKWLAAHCAEYGFIIRYPEGKEDITGYNYEPWHVRYLGIETATAVYESGLCLEEYLGISSVYEY